MASGSRNTPRAAVVTLSLLLVVAPIAGTASAVSTGDVSSGRPGMASDGGRSVAGTVDPPRRADRAAERGAPRFPPADGRPGGRRPSATDADANTATIIENTSGWRTETAGDANATAINRTALDFRVYRCSYANATRRLGDLAGNLTLSFDYNVTAEQWHEKAYVELYEDGRPVALNDTVPQEESSTVTGRFNASVPVDGNISVEVGIRPSNFCSNSDHANTYFHARNVTVDVRNRTPVRFFDGFEDGDYTSDPEWRVARAEGDFDATVVERNSTPTDGTRALRLHETTGGGTAGAIVWDTPVCGWGGEWRLGGAFYTENLDPAVSTQSHGLAAYKRDGAVGIEARLGFTEPDGSLAPFEIRGDLVGNATLRQPVNWSADTWYRYEVAHDGNGTYTGRLWEADGERPAAPTARSVGRPPGATNRTAGLSINGAQDSPLDVDHAFLRWNAGRCDTLVVAKNGSGDYRTIENAVENASAGDRIEVEPGTYNESVTVDVPVSIVGDPGDGSAGAGPDAPVMYGKDDLEQADGGPTKPDLRTAFEITPDASGTTVRGFEIRRYMAGVRLAANGTGLRDVTVSGTTIVRLETLVEERSNDCYTSTIPPGIEFALGDGGAVEGTTLDTLVTRPKTVEFICGGRRGQWSVQTNGTDSRNASLANLTITNSSLERSGRFSLGSRGVIHGLRFTRNDPFEFTVRTGADSHVRDVSVRGNDGPGSFTGWVRLGVGNGTVRGVRFAENQNLSGSLDFGNGTVTSGITITRNEGGRLFVGRLDGVDLGTQAPIDGVRLTGNRGMYLGMNWPIANATISANEGTTVGVTNGIEHAEVTDNEFKSFEVYADGINPNRDIHIGGNRFAWDDGPTIFLAGEGSTTLESIEIVDNRFEISGEDFNRHAIEVFVDSGSRVRSLDIRDNDINMSGSNDEAIALSAFSSTVRDVAITNNSVDIPDGATGVEVYSYPGTNTTARITDNRISTDGRQVSVSFGQQGANVTVAGNRLQGGRYGVSHQSLGGSAPEGLTIRQNAINGSSRAAIRLENDSSAAIDGEYVRIERNRIAGTPVGVDVGERFPAGTVVARENNFLNASGIGVRNPRPGVLDARNNYWGAADGPSSNASTTLRDPNSGAAADGSGAAVTEDPDDAGSSNVRFDPYANDSFDVRVPAPGGAPTAAFTYAPANATVGDSIRFDASNTTAGGTVDSYAWDFGDGASAAGEVVSHTYDAPGNYTVVLTVTDDQGRNDTASETIAVDRNRTGRLSLEFDVGRGASGLPTGTVEPNGTLPVTLRLTNTGATNITGLRVRVRYGFPETFAVDAARAANGTWNATAGVWNRTDLSPGEAAAPAINVTVPPDADEGAIHSLLAGASDGNGTRLASGGGLFGVVNASAANVAPEPAVTVNVSEPRVGELVRFDANASSDPDGDDLTYRWDLDGDREFEASGERVTYGYREPGNYSVALVVNDGTQLNATTWTLSVAPREREPINDTRVNLAAENVTVLAGAEATMAFTVENNASGNLSDVGIEVGSEPLDGDLPFRPPDDDRLPAGLRVVGYGPDGGTWDRANDTWSAGRLEADGTATPNLTLAVDADVSADRLELPVRATVGGEVAARETAAVDVVPVFNGLFPPRVDGRLGAREWAEGYDQSVSLVPESGGDRQGRMYVKTTDGRLYLGLHAFGGGWLRPGERLARVRVGIDRDGNGSLSEGDVRLTARWRAADAAFEITGLEVYRGGAFEETGPIGQFGANILSGFAAAPDPRVPEDTIVEASLPVALIDEALGDPAAGTRPGERIGVSVAVTTVEFGDSLAAPVETTRYRVTDAADRGATYPVSGVAIPRERWTSEVTAPRVDLELDHVEITQAVQRPDNSLSTVRGKETLARAFVTHNRSNRRLEVAVEFVAWDLSGDAARYLGSETRNVSAPAAFDRADMDDSANLVLPAEWRNRERLALRVSAYPLNAVDVGGGDDAEGEEKRFVETHDLVVYRIPINNRSRANPRTPPDALAREVSENLSAAFPTSPRFVTLDWRIMDEADSGPVYNDPPNQTNVIVRDLAAVGEDLQASAALRERAGAPGDAPIPDQVYGITTRDPFVRGDSDPSWLGRPSLAAIGTGYPLTMAHEVVHNLGNGTSRPPYRGWGHHVANSSDEADRGVIYGRCGSNLDFPGGLDGRWQDLYDDGAIHALGWNSETDELVVPATSDVMTYCPFGRWMSTYRWEHLVDRLRTFEPGEPTHPDEQGNGGLFSLSGLDSPTDGLAASNRTVLGREVPTVRLVTGTLYRNGSGELDPSFERPGRATRAGRTVENATARLRITRANGSTSTIPVAARFTGVEGQTYDRAPFSVMVPDNGTIRRVELLDPDDGDVLDARSATNWTLDRVVIDTPGRFDRHDATDVGIDVSATNVSRDRLRLKLLYSPAPETGFWYPYGRARAGDTVNATFTELPGNDTARFLLLVSDGVRTEFVTSDTFAVPHDPPEVEIDRGDGSGDAPGINATVGGTVSLDARAQTESGARLEGARLQWRATDADGTVVATDSGSFTHRFRSAGTYRVRAVATDPRTGLTATDTVRVAVEAAPVPDNGTIRAFQAAINSSASQLANETCVPRAVAGDDSRISLTEIQTAINWWAEGRAVPNTGGETISLSGIQSLINAWAEGRTVSC